MLIIDDEESSRNLAAIVLGRAGFKTQLAVDGHEGLHLLEADPPDLVVLDLMMPRMDGHQVLKRMLMSPRLRRIPVIFVSANDQEPNVVIGIGLGAADYITKPFRPRELLERVQRILSPEPAPPPAPPPMPPPLA
ncbi:MAG: response regulator [Planctomycetota bacterium]